jgi:hypothetical protein
MGYAIWTLIFLVVAAIAAWLWFSGGALTKSVEAGAQTGTLQERSNTLRYTPPPGQDPAVVILALDRAGFASEPHSDEEPGRVVIACPDGVERDRERIRTVIESADTTSLTEGVTTRPTVRFEDEKGRSHDSNLR